MCVTLTFFFFSSCVQSGVRSFVPIFPCLNSTSLSYKYNLSWLIFRYFWRYTFPKKGGVDFLLERVQCNSTTPTCGGFGHISEPGIASVPETTSVPGIVQLYFDTPNSGPLRSQSKKSRGKRSRKINRKGKKYSRNITVSSHQRENMHL